MKNTRLTSPARISGGLSLKLTFAALGCAVLAIAARADTIALKSVADSFVFTGVGPNATGYYDAASRNFGGMNSRQVAGAGTSRGEFDSVIRFDAASAAASFDTLYGVGNWDITGVTLTLCTSANVAGPGIFNAPGSSGLFNVSWMSRDSGWLQGSGYKNNGTGAGNAADHDVTGVNFTSGITWNSLHTTLNANPATLLNTCSVQSLGTLVSQTFDLGTSSAAFLAALESGDSASLLLTPGDSTVAFNFTSRTYGGGVDPYNPTLTLTVVSVPEPQAVALLGLGLLAVGARLCAKRQPQQLRQKETVANLR